MAISGSNDPEIATAISRLRYNGEDRETGEYHYHGYTALLDNVQASVLDLKLKYLPEWIEWRRHIADLYSEGLTGVGDLVLPHFEGEQYYDAFQNYVIRTPERDELAMFLKDEGVESLISLPKPYHVQPDLKLTRFDLPMTLQVAREVISLPMYPELEDWQIETTVGAVRKYFNR